MKKTGIIRSLSVVVTVASILTAGSSVMTQKKVSAASNKKYAAAVVNIALAEEGYREYANNKCKYSEDIDNMRRNGQYFYNGYKNGAAEWCDIFVDWCFIQAYGFDAARQMTGQTAGHDCGAGVKYSYSYYSNHPSYPQPGDQIFFKDSSNTMTHTGLVYAVYGGRVYTIEGNVSKSVGKRDYPLGSSKIKGYGRATFDADPNNKYNSFVTGLYSGILGRTPDAGGFNSWINTLTSGNPNKTVTEVAWEFFCSNEFKNKSISDSAYIDCLYKGLLGRNADANGKNYWLSVIGSQGREGVFRGVIKSDEFRNRCSDMGIIRQYNKQN